MQQFAHFGDPGLEPRSPGGRPGVYQQPAVLPLAQMDMVTSLISNYERNPSKYFLHLGDVQSLLGPVGERSHLMNFPVREGGAMLLSLRGGLDSYRVGARHGEARPHHIQGLSYGVANLRYFNRRYDVKSDLIDFKEN